MKSPIHKRSKLIKEMPENENSLTDYSEDGVDLTLIRATLSLTPAERLEMLQSNMDDILAIRELNAGR